jgi:hypothetical protein
MRNEDGGCTQSTCSQYDSNVRKNCNRLLSIPRGECEIYEEKEGRSERG